MKGLRVIKVAAFEIRLSSWQMGANAEAFAEAYLCFLVSALAKEVKVIKFLGILKK